MAWITVPGLAGKVYVPDSAGQAQKKHACKTCFSCQWCDETRCQVCRDERAAPDGNDQADACTCRRPSKTS
jgi:hypothetical protein